MTPAKKEPSDTLLASILPILLERGPKHTTMDTVAARLSMSKRTLYEIFDSKEEMLAAVLRFHHRVINARNEYIQASSANMMEAMVRILLYHIESMKDLSPDFFRDMDKTYAKLRKVYDRQPDQFQEQPHSKDNEDRMHQSLKLGIAQGVFLPSLNIKMTMAVLRLQLESLKRMEEYFPPDVSFAEVLRHIMIGFLRSIATAKGIEVLESIINNDEGTANHNAQDTLPNPQDTIPSDK